MAKSDYDNLPRRQLFGGAVTVEVKRLGTSKERKDCAEAMVAAVSPPAKRGRPKVEGQRPWEAEGISRQAWYKRRQKAKAGAKE